MGFLAGFGETTFYDEKIEPLVKAEKELEDFRVMVELGEAEPESAQAKIQQELEGDLARFFKALDEIATLEFLRAQPRAIRVIDEEFV